MSEARAICGQCSWRGLLDITPARPMGLQACPRCGRRALYYAEDALEVVQAYGPVAHEHVLRTE